MLVSLVRLGGGVHQDQPLTSRPGAPHPDLLTTPVFFLIAADPVHSLPATVDLQALGSGYNSRIHSSLDSPPDL